MTLVTQVELAERQGVTKQAVGKWKKRGLLVFEEGLVHLEKTVANLEKYRTAGSTPVDQPPEPSFGDNRRRVEKMTARDDESAADAAGRILEAIGATWDMEEAKRIKENYLALLNKLDYEKKSGEVVDLKTAQDILFDEFRKQRDSWLNWPSRVAPMLAADLGVEADKVVLLLNEHVHKHIAQLGTPEGSFGEAA